MAVERTCIGCRSRDDRSRLVRVVMDPSGDQRVVPDLRRMLPGRGAWIHPGPECVEHATRRQAFARALRVPAPVTITDVVASINLTPGEAVAGQPPSSTEVGND